MRSSIDKVKGAVAKKDLVPQLTSLHFYKNRVQASNGRLTIDAPCDSTIEVTVPMLPFLKALEGCNTEPVLKLVNDKLRVSSQKFKADIQLSSEEYPLSTPDAKPVKCASMLAALKLVYDFIGTDITRPWSCGVLFKDSAAFATNNIVLAKADTTFSGELNIPSGCVDELLRLSTDPVSVAITPSTATFYYADTMWIKTVLLSTAWPDLSAMFQFEELPILPATLREDVTRIAPFSDPRLPTIQFKSDGIVAVEATKSAEVLGYELPDAYFRVDPLLSVLAVATHADFSKYPKPCPFYGNGVKGVIIGCTV